MASMHDRVDLAPQCVAARWDLLDFTEESEAAGWQNEAVFSYLLIDAAWAGADTNALWTQAMRPRNVSQPGHGLGNLRDGSVSGYCENIRFSQSCSIVVDIGNNDAG